MNIVVVVDDMLVETYKKWSDVKKSHPQLTKEDFVQHGNDFVTMLDKQSYMISKDIKLLETVASERVFGKKQIDWATVFSTAIITLLAVLFVVN